MKTTREIYDNDITLYSGKWEQYFPLYDRYFSKFIGKAPNVLEIGIDNGGSLQMWHHYLENPTICGVDIRPKINDIGFPNVDIVQGDQGDINFWNRLISSYPKFDIIIDDGSHFMQHQIMTLEILFPHLNENGIYFVEDTHSSYMDIFGGSYKGNTFIEYTKNLIDSLHADYYQSNEQDWHRTINGIHYYDSVVVLEKQTRSEYRPTFANREKYI